MTAMPQMVALFNGVGGGAVALIAWSEFRTTDGFAGEPMYVVIGVAVLRDHRLGLVLGLADRLRQAAGDPARAPDRARARRSRSSTALLLVGAVACAVVDRRWAAAAELLDHRPAGARARCSACWWCCRSAAPTCRWSSRCSTRSPGCRPRRPGSRSNNTAMIVAGMIVGASGSILTNLMAKAMNRSIPAIVAGGFGGGGAGGRAAPTASTARCGRRAPPTPRSRWPTRRR